MPDQADLPEVDSQPDVTLSVGGETVAATRYSPADAVGPLPVLLMAVPYHKDDFITYGSHDPHIRYLAANGYEVVVADMVGTGASSGTKGDLLDAEPEADELVELIDRLADREWSNGRVGMFGTSYGGLTCLEAASRNPDPLEAIVPVFGPSTGWKDQTRSGSVAMYNNLGHWGPLMHTLEAKPPSYRDDEGAWADRWETRLSNMDDDWTPYLFRLLEHESKDEYWEGKDVPVDRIQVPTFAVGGWRDARDYAQTAIDYYERIDAYKRLLLGPWRHTKPYRGRESSIDFRRQTLEWFDHFLKDEDTGALDWPAVSYWTERNGGGRIDEGTWRGRDNWLRADGDEEALTYALAPEGIVAPEEFTAGELAREYEYDHTVGLASMDRGVMGGTPVPTNDDDARSLCFETGPLERPVELTGTGQISFRLRATTTDPIVFVRLVDVDPNGAGHYVTSATLRLPYRGGRTSPEPIKSGEEYKVNVQLSPKSHVFEAGHCMRVAVSAAYFPVMLPPREHGSFTVLSAPEDPSTVSFPGCVHEEDVAFDDEQEMAPPDRSVPVDSAWEGESDSKWAVECDHLNDVATVRGGERATLHPPHADVTWSQDVEASVAADDPSTATIRQESSFILEYPTEVVRVEGTTGASRQSAWATVSVHRDGTTVFKNRWRWTRAGETSATLRR